MEIGKWVRRWCIGVGFGNSNFEALSYLHRKIYVNLHILAIDFYCNTIYSLIK